MLTEFFDRIIRALTPRPPHHPATPETAKPPVLAGQFFKTPSPSLNPLPLAFSHASSINSTPLLPTPSPFAPRTASSSLPTPPNPRVISPGYFLLNTFASYGSGGSPFLVHPGLLNPIPPISGLPPPSFAFGRAKDPETMSEPEQSAAPTLIAAPAPATAASPPASTAPHPTAVPQAAKSDDEKESSVTEIPYFKLHAAHLSALRGHTKYLELLNRKKGCEGKLDKMIAEYGKIIKDTKTAAVIAGIVRDDSQPPEKRKSRPSVSFADQVEIHASPAYKKTKSKPTSTAILKRRRGNAGKRKPTAEAQATLRSFLGKRSRSSTETSEEDEETSQKPFKRPRVRIFQEGDPLGKYVGDPDSDDEDSDSDSFKSAASKSEPTPADGNTAKAASPPAATPTTTAANTKAAKATFSPSMGTASTTRGATSPTATPVVPKPTPRASQTKHTANDNPAASKSPKMQKQASTSASSSSSADCLFAIRPPLPGKHVVDDEAGSEKSAKKQKQKSAPAASASNNNTNASQSASASASAPMAPPTIAQSPAKRSAGGANVSQPNIKRNKKDNEN